MYITTLRPSQWTNLGYIILGVGLSPFTAGLTLVVPIWKMIETYCTKYEFYEDRIIHRRGVFTVTTDEILLYRVKAINLNEPLLYRLVDIADLSIMTSDRYVNEIVLHAIPVGVQFRDTLREMVEENRTKKGVKEFDLYELSQ
jgi:uncharacterized membrane protein YdbT with pleckstrin-like domain